jgi:hypothetical protein
MGISVVKSSQDLTLRPKDPIKMNTKVTKKLFTAENAEFAEKNL